MKKALMILAMVAVLGVGYSCTQETVTGDEIKTFSPDPDKIDPPGGNGNGGNG